MTMKKAVCYYRTFAQEDNYGSHTMERQKTECKEYAKINRLKVVAEFHDFDIRGTDSFSKRPAHLNMMSFIKDNAVDVLLTQHTNRMAQSVELQMFVQDKLRYLGINYAPIDQASTFADFSSSNCLMQAIIGGMNEYIETTRADAEGRKRPAILSDNEQEEWRKLRAILKPSPAVRQKRKPQATMTA